MNRMILSACLLVASTSFVAAATICDSKEILRRAGAQTGLQLTAAIAEAEQEILNRTEQSADAKQNEGRRRILFSVLEASLDAALRVTDVVAENELFGEVGRCSATYSADANAFRRAGAEIAEKVPEAALMQVGLRAEELGAARAQMRELVAIVADRSLAQTADGHPDTNRRRITFSVKRTTSGGYFVESQFGVRFY